MKPSSKHEEILRNVSHLMASNMDEVPPVEWLRISATIALATIDMIDGSAETKREVADKYCEIFKQGLVARMDFNQFMDKIMPTSLN